MGEGEIFQFAAHFTHSKAVRDGRIDFESLAGDPLTAFRRQSAERPHVVQAVRQLDDDDADIVHHRQQHFSIVFRLAILGRIKVDLVELGDAIHARRDFFAEQLAELVGGNGGVFHNVVESNPVWMVTGSMRISARSCATARGWDRYGSPDARFCPA